MEVVTAIQTCVAALPSRVIHSLLLFLICGSKSRIYTNDSINNEDDEESKTFTGKLLHKNAFNHLVQCLIVSENTKN